MTEEEELAFRRVYIRALANEKPRNDEMEYKTNHEYPLNGYEMMAQDYEKFLQRPYGEYFDAADARKIEMKIKALRILAKLEEEEIDALFDTSAFNNIVKGYLIAALENAELTEEQRDDIRDGLRFALDEMSAWDARRKYER